MPDSDNRLDRWSKISGLLLPIVVAAVGGVYTLQKDANDTKVREREDRKDAYQKEWDKQQQKYSNLTSLLPLLTSQNTKQVAMGVEIFGSEAHAGHAPLELLDAVKRIGNEDPELTAAVQQASAAARLQMGEECRFISDGVYIHVENNKDQLDRGQVLAGKLRAAGFTVQGVQRIATAPRHTDLRYYASTANDNNYNKLAADLARYGFQAINKVNLSALYLKKDCAPPGIFELWIGSDAPLTAEGTAGR
jgi:hypothetical protein